MIKHHDVAYQCNNYFFLYHSFVAAGVFEYCFLSVLKKDMRKNFGFYCKALCAADVQHFEGLQKFQAFLFKGQF